MRTIAPPFDIRMNLSSSPRSTGSGTSSDRSSRSSSPASLQEVDLTGPTTHTLDRLLATNASQSTSSSQPPAWSSTSKLLQHRRRRPSQAVADPSSAFAFASSSATASPAVSAPSLDFSQEMARFHRTTPQSFTQATRRLLQRERVIHRDRPDLAVERVQLAEISPPNPGRDAALRHGARAYAAVGYMYALLAFVVTILATAFLLAVARAVASDVSRKTRELESTLATKAAECAEKMRNHQCAVDGDLVSHASTEVASLCREWAACARGAPYARQDARSAKVWAETLADIGNAFAERVSSATMVVSLAFLVVVVFLVSSAAFGFLHRRVASDAQMHGISHGSVPASPAQSTAPTGTPVRRAIKFDLEDEPENMLTPRRRIAR